MAIDTLCITMAHMTETDDRERLQNGMGQLIHDLRGRLQYAHLEPGMYVDRSIGQIVDPDNVRFID